MSFLTAFHPTSPALSIAIFYSQVQAERERVVDFPPERLESSPWNPSSVSALNLESPPQMSDREIAAEALLSLGTGPSPVKLQIRAFDGNVILTEFGKKGRFAAYAGIAFNKGDEVCTLQHRVRLKSFLKEIDVMMKKAANHLIVSIFFPTMQEAEANVAIRKISGKQSRIFAIKEIAQGEQMRILAPPECFLEWDRVIRNEERS